MDAQVAEERSDATPQEGLASIMGNPVYLGPHLHGGGHPDIDASPLLSEVRHYNLMPNWG